MSTAISARPPTPAQRATEATEHTAELLHVADAKRLGSALTLAAAEAVRSNPTFAAQVRALYDELAPRRAASPRPAAPRAPRGKRVAPDIELVPVKSMEGYDFDPLAPPDPYFLLEFYGAHQLRLALARYTVPRLREAVKHVKESNPHTRPTGASQEALVDYIVQYVAGA